MEQKSRPCGNNNCSVSTGVCERTTFGHGNLNFHGYWEYGCETCARAFEVKCPEYGPCWPDPGTGGKQEGFEKTLMVPAWDNENENQQPDLNVREAAELLGISSPLTVKNWLQGGYFPEAYQNAEGEWKYPAASVESVKKHMEELRERSRTGDLSPPDCDDELDWDLMLAGGHAIE